MNDSVNLKFETLVTFLKRIKNRGMVSNSTFSAIQLKNMLLDKRYRFRLADNTLVIYETDRDITRLYFYTRGLDTIRELKDIIIAQPNLVCDFISKRTDNMEEIAKELISIGFSQYAVFIRMLCKNIKRENSVIYNKVEFAEPNDLDEIYSMLYNTFDKYTAHFPERNTILKRIYDREVFVVRGNGLIKGFSIFNSKDRKVAIFDYSIVRDEYRRQKIANDLLNYKLKYHNNSKCYYLWINEAFTNFIKFHNQNHFYEDGVIDTVFVHGVLNDA